MIVEATGSRLQFGHDEALARQGPIGIFTMKGMKVHEDAVTRRESTDLTAATAAGLRVIR